MYQKVNPQLETAVNLGWTASKNETTFGIGAKYALDKDAWVRAKVNNSSHVGLGYQQRLRDGKFCVKNLNFRISFLQFHSQSEVFSRVYNFLFLFSGVTLSLSTLIDGKNFQAGGHKVGLCLELEA